MRLFLRVLIVLTMIVVGIMVYNSSWLTAPNPDAKLHLIAHRGIHQTFRATS